MPRLSFPGSRQAAGLTASSSAFRLVVTEPLAPNNLYINSHLYKLFDPVCVQPYPDAWIEIAHSYPATGAVNAAETFSVAEAKNKAGCNVYVGPTLRRGERPRGGRARRSAQNAT